MTSSTCTIVTSFPCRRTLTPGLEKFTNVSGQPRVQVGSWLRADTYGETEDRINVNTPFVSLFDPFVCALNFSHYGSTVTYYKCP